MATIGKKFIEPDKWESAWFSRLSPGQKLLYCYLWERADHSGVIEIVYPVWSAHIGQEVNEDTLKKLMEAVNRDKERIKLFGEKLYLCEYIRFQQKPDKEEPLSGTHGMTKTIVRHAKGHGLYDEIKNRDPVLFSAFENESAVSELSKPSASLAKDYGKGLSKSKSQIRSESESGSPPPGGREKKEILSHVAERCLNVWPQSADEIFFSEAILAENYLRQQTVKGESVQDAEARLTKYLEAQKGNGRELEDVLKTLIE